MFQKLPEAADAVLVHVEGRAIRVPAGATAAAAALIAGLVSTRTQVESVCIWHQKLLVE